MFRHILLPLDGSRLAEAAVPVAAAMARKFGSAVTLLHVIERDAPAVIHGEPHLGQPAEADAYLAGLARRYFDDPERPARHVHTEREADVARSIVLHAGELRSDLVLLCTHGRSNLRHRLFGSVAQYVLAHRTVPVLLVPPSEHETPPGFPCRRLLVPLDGRPEHEQGLEWAVTLARAAGATIRVLWVVPTLATLSGEQAVAGHLLPGTASALLDLEETGAARYVQERLDRMGVSTLDVAIDVVRGDATHAILDAAARTETDLIVAGTHGRVGMDAFWAASVAQRLARRVRVPLLLVPLSTETQAA
jgi:nucleotide-binding universal stress UspA family protein